jgi:hypothetical protein
MQEKKKTKTTHASDGDFSLFIMQQPFLLYYGLFVQRLLRTRHIESIHQIKQATEHVYEITCGVRFSSGACCVLSMCNFALLQCSDCGFYYTYKELHWFRIRNELQDLDKDIIPGNIFTWTICGVCRKCQVSRNCGVQSRVFLMGFRIRNELGSFMRNGCTKIRNMRRKNTAVKNKPLAIISLNTKKNAH